MKVLTCARRKRLLVLPIVFASLMAATAEAADRPDVTVAVTNLTTHLDPMGFNANVNMRVSQNVVETLIKYNFKTGGLEPGLATAWHMVDDRTMELEIRQSVKCHNGEDFTAEDVEVMFGPERYQGENAPGNKVAGQFLGTIASVEATGDYTVRVRTKAPDPLLDIRLASWMSEIPCADAYREAASWEDWGQKVVGTGPYRIAEVRGAELHRLEAFDDYWGAKPPLNSVTFKVVPEIGTRIAGLLAGDFDIVTEIVPDQFETLDGSEQAEVVGGPVRNIRSIAYDLRHPVLKDARVRRAMALAIDRQLIVDTIFKGRTTIPNGMQMKSFGNMYIEDFKAASYDPDMARKLLAEAGYNGEPISFQYLTDYYSGEVVTTQILQQMWRDVGLNVTLDLKENWDQILDDKQIGVRGIINDSNNAVYPDPIGQLYRVYGPDGFYQERGYWSNEHFNALGEKLFVLDHKVRRDAFRDLLKIYETDAPGTTLYTLTMFYGKRKSLSWTPNDTPFMDFRAGNVSFAGN